MSGTYQAPEGWVGNLCTYDRDDDTHIATARAPARPSCSHPLVTVRVGGRAAGGGGAATLSALLQITYNRPEAANAINLEMREDINSSWATFRVRPRPSRPPALSPSS